MSKLLTGSINYDVLKEALKTGMINAQKAENGTRYININVWVNDQPDQYGNDGSIQLQFKKEYQHEKKIYIGNLKTYTPKIQEATANDFSNEDEDDDLPF